MNAPLISAQALQVSIGEHAVCTDLDFSLQVGERLAILGRNGAGKSTLLSVLAGLRTADVGEVRLSGQNYAELGPREAAKRRGWLPQRHGDAFASSVLETALTGRHPHLGRWDWETNRDTEIARGALKAVGLAGLEDRDVQTLSGGERQRLAIATLLTQGPPLYLLDEPLAHLDLNHQIAVLDLFAGAAKDCGAGVIMVLHEPGLADRYCDRALLIHGDGRTELGSCREMLTAPCLTELYGHPLKEVESDGHRWFIPC
ncbi:MAG: ABC transporter ATP-binding protein [Betaproteobacteria bacterium]|uniref:ABC transporter ATP-binding protein n=1 Tax=Candidatus Proximibacter danicus TaxID=2954365 RepID=A0A9D7K0L3_9PROT|nr:ABC transporter ATP-binding protein [Candidatus Proximibacter danicus]MBK9447477.1 ABC transporter ATP-binding protein [Betaproteobacteria bacterium]